MRKVLRNLRKPSWYLPFVVVPAIVFAAVAALYFGQPEEEAGEMIVEAVTTELVADPGEGNIEVIDVPMTSELTGEEYTVREIFVDGTADDGPFRTVMLTVQVGDEWYSTDCGTGLAGMAFVYAGQIQDAREADDQQALEIAQLNYTRQFTLNSACQAAGFIA